MSEEPSGGDGGRGVTWSKQQAEDNTAVVVWLHINGTRAQFALGGKGEAMGMDCSLSDSTALLCFTGETETYMTDLRCKS